MDYNNNNGEKPLTPNELEHQSRSIMLEQEQPVVDDVEMVNNPNAPKSIINPEIQEQYDQAKEPSEEMIKLREYKQRQMEEFTNNYSISQVIPSGWTTFFNVVNTIFLTLALIIAFFVAFGLLFGLRIGIVPTASMEPNIPVGSLVIIKPLSSVDEVHISDILSYKLKEGDSVSYIHRVTKIGAKEGENGKDTLIELKGDNVELTQGQSHTISFRLVEGKMVMSIPLLGYVIAFIKDNIFLTIAVFATLIIAMFLIRSVVERKHARMEIDRFLTLKAEFEEEAERKYLEQKKKQENKEFEKIMKTQYGENDIVETTETQPQNETQNMNNHNTQNQ